MPNAIFSYLGKGAKKLGSNPQLIYTVVVAVITVGAFVFMANRFIGIANDAGDRLVNVRVGSIQDAFVTFAADKMDDAAYLDKQINNIVGSNETIKSFVIVKQMSYVDRTSSTTIPNAYVVIASNNPKEIGESNPQASFLYAMASADTTHSLTFEFTQNGERMFNTTRAITDTSGNILGVVMTTQTLSAADKAIQNNINGSLILLVVIIIIVVLLFLRHSKIIDYMDLYKRLKDVDQLKDDFISMASHELRTPLTVIRGYAEYMREAPELAPATKEYAVKIDVSAKGLDSLVSDILDVSRIQQGRMSFNMEKISPKDIIESVVSSLEFTAKEKSLELGMDMSKIGSEQILADKDRLRQVLVNIIGNAVKYTPKGSVHVSSDIQNGRFQIRVEDTGLGISAEERERLFEKFYRVKTKETENIRGTGLGLWITAQIVKEMKGTITLESIKGVGSHFIISFPIIK